MTKSEKANEYLMKRRYLRREIEGLEYTITTERNRLIFLSNICQADLLGSKGFKALEKTIKHCKANRETEYKELCELIDRIPVDRYRDVLRLHFIDGLTLEEIADKMFYSLPTIARIQGKAFNVVADLCDFQDD